MPDKELNRYKWLMIKDVHFCICYILFLIFKTNFKIINVLIQNFIFRRLLKE